MSNSRILLISAIVIVASFLALVFMPRPAAEQIANNSSQQAQSAMPEPKVLTFAQFFSSMTAQEKVCFTEAVGAERAADLGKGSSSITDQELGQLNDCIK